MPAYPFKENLMWIVDRYIDLIPYREEVPDRSIPFEAWAERNRQKEEERLRKSIELAHALGLKCDIVGWCRLDMDRPDIDAVLERIDAFRLSNGYYLRGIYTRRNADFDSEWYLLDVPGRYMSGWGNTKIADKSGKVWTLPAVRAYKIPKTVQADTSPWLPNVNEHFRNCCLRHGFSGVDLYWIRDIGRYRATQFFGMIVDRLVPEFACDRYLTYSEKKHYNNAKFDHSVGSPLYRRYQALGGKLPVLSQMFYDLMVFLPIQLPKSKMPETDFAYVNFNRSYYRRTYVLIRKHAAQKLLAEKAIRKEYLSPVVLYEEEPEGYWIQKCEPIEYPPADVVRQLNDEYEQLKQSPRPEWKVSDKDALKLFRAIKKLRTEDFRKGLAKKIRETFAGTRYEPLSPYYSVSDGGKLSNEYEFLPWSEALEETRAYDEQMEKEELHEVRHAGIAIARCGDGDIVILCDDGSVRRINHEAMEECESWDTVAQFFYDVLSDA